MDGKLVPVARSKAPVNEFVKIADLDGEEVMLEYRRFDLADFRLNEQESAFGVYEEDYTSAALIGNYCGPLELSGTAS